jgi:hypothetical protein
LGIGVVVKNADSPQAKHEQSYLHQQLSTIPVDDIKNYLQLHMDADDTHSLTDGGQQITNENLDEDLSDYLDTN